MMHALKKCFIRTAAFLLLFVPSVIFLVPGPAQAEEAKDVVRVGWFDSSFNTMDEAGRKSGYAYEYQLKIAAYTGWSYEYVSGSWPDLLQMLEKGEIDLLSDVSYTPERSEHMLFSSFPMGTEEYYLFIAPGNQEIVPGDPTSVNGKKIGVNQGSIQAALYEEWAELNGVSAGLTELTCSETQSLEMLDAGELDAYVTVDSFTNPELAEPVFKLGSSDFFFAVSKDRSDLLADLDYALGRIQSENRYYNEQMFVKYFKRTGANAFLSPEEVEWITRHGTIRVGYQDNYLAFCAQDPETGELTGVLKDYLDYAADCVANVHLDFEAVSFPTASAAMEALDRGEVDCMFPANLDGYDQEKNGLIMTPALVNTEINAVVRISDPRSLVGKEHVIVAVNEGNPNYDSFLDDHYPHWKKVYYPTTKDCLKAVSNGVADCILVSNFRYNNLSRLCDEYRLTTLSTGVGLDYCFAVKNGNAQLYSILSKTTGLVPASAVHASLSFYITEDAKLTFADLISDNIYLVTGVAAVILLTILGLMFKSMRAERKAKNLILATETDDLTGLYNRNFFFQYAYRMYHEHPDLPMDAIVLNIEQFHSVNALNGREFGDRVLRVLGSEIRSVSDQHGGIAGRFEADRFDIYCRHTEDYREIYDRLQDCLSELAPNTSIRLRMGVMPWQEKLDPVQMFDQARTACSMARGHYKEHLVTFDEQVRKSEIYEQRLMNDLRRALDSYEFEVYYQPKFNIQTEPPALVGAEALVRWRHPEFGMIPPDDFIPLLEKNGQISLVDQYVWGEAARQIVRWREESGAVVPVSVNLSRVDVFDPELESALDTILQYHDLDHQSFRLEVTETAYTENADQVIRVVKGLRSKGYVVEMDDFGTGYSSLNMLSAMPVDVLKMDRAFVRNIEYEEKDIQLVALILDIAKNLRIPVVAEGVETEGQVKLLKDLGCPLVQGYYFSRPLPASVFEETFIRNVQQGQDPLKAGGKEKRPKEPDPGSVISAGSDTD